MNTLTQAERWTMLRRAPLQEALEADEVRRTKTPITLPSPTHPSIMKLLAEPDEETLHPAEQEC
jgi:hypothetical protein